MDDPLKNCEWLCSITNCKNAPVHHAIYYVSTVINVVAACFSLGILLYRQRLPESATIWAKGMFTPMNGMLLWTGIFTALRAFSNIVQLLDLFSANLYARQLVLASSFWAGNVGLFAYHAGTLSTLPKLCIHTFSTTALPGACHCKRTGKPIWAPHDGMLSLIFWALTGLTAVSLAVCATLAAYYIDRGDHHAFLVAFGVCWSTLWFASILIAVSHVSIGRRFVQLTIMNFDLLGMGDGENGGRRLIDRRAVVFKAYIRKMQTITYGCGLIFVIQAVALLPLALFYDAIFDNVEISMVYCVLLLLIIPFMILTLLITMLMAEMHPGKSGTGSGDSLSNVAESLSYPPTDSMTHALGPSDRASGVPRFPC